MHRKRGASSSEAPQHDHHNITAAKSQPKFEIGSYILPFARFGPQNVVELPILIFLKTTVIIKIKIGDTNDLTNQDPHEKPDRRRAFT